MQQPAVRPRLGHLPPRGASPEPLALARQQIAVEPALAGPSRPAAAPADTLDLQKIERRLGRWVEAHKEATLPPPRVGGLAIPNFQQTREQSVYTTQAAVLAAARSNASSLQIHGLQATKLPAAAIHQLPGLEHLAVQGTLCRQLPEFAHHFTKLNKLELIGNPELDKLPDSLGELKGLKTLEIRNSVLLRSLPEGIGDLTQLDTLKLTGTSITELPSTLTKLSDSLGTLEVSRPPSPTTDNGLQKLPDNIGDLKALTTLNLRGQDRLNELPASLGTLPKLETLDLSGCSNLTKLPDLSQLSGLKTLDLSGCSKLNVLPKSLARQLPADCKIKMPNGSQQQALDAMRPRTGSAAGTSGGTQFQARPPEETAARQQLLEGWTNQLKPFKNKGEAGAGRFNLWMGAMVQREGQDMGRLDALVKAAADSPKFRAKLFAFAAANVQVPRNSLGMQQTDRATINLTGVSDAHNLLLEHRMSDPQQMSTAQAFGTLKKLVAEQETFGQALVPLAFSRPRPGTAGSQPAHVPPVLAAYVHTHDPVGSGLMAEKGRLSPDQAAEGAAAIQETLNLRYAAVAKELLAVSGGFAHHPSPSSATPRR